MSRKLPVAERKRREVARERMQQECQCGCGQFEWNSRLKEVSIEQAVDLTLRETHTSRRFWVRDQCREAFLEELGLMVLLEQLVRAWAPGPKTFLQRLNVPRTFWRWCRRMMAALRVMRMTHAIYVRPKGFAYAHDRAVRSAVLFGAPRFIQGFLARRFLARDKEKEKADGTRSDPTIVPVEAEA